MIPKLPGHAARVIEAIQAAGGRGYLVGGALRDLLMGGLPTDWDFAATLTPTRLMATFPGAKLIGGSCGTVEALFTNSEGDPYGRWHCQITPCRREDGYSDARHPDVVEFVPDILADLARRDFTVNAIAYDGEILLDPFGGQQDIRRRLLRCVGNAEKRFEEDALRVLRLYRFAAQLGFTAQWGTFRAANEAMDKLATLPGQRVLDEMELILASAGPQVLSGVIAMGGLAGYGFHFAPSLAVLAEVPNLPLCRWWALAALCGADVREVCAAFGFSKRFRAQLLAVTALYRAGPSATGTALKQKLRNQKLDYAPLAATFAAVSPAYSAEPAIFAAVCARHEAYRINQLAINGSMLAEEGITGRLCGRVLSQLLDAVIQNPALNKKDVLLGLARGLKLIL